MLKRYFVAVFLFISAASLAQEGTTSPYSFYGIGTLKFKGTAENRTMGGIGVYSDSIHLNLQNPAGVAELGLVAYALGASHKYVDQSTTDENQQASTTSLDYIAMGIPMGKFGASFGLIPYTAVGYQLESENPPSVTQYTGEGGLNKAFFALAYKLLPGLSVGVEANYNFGNIENIATTFQEEVQFGSREVNRSDLLGFSYTFGAQYRRMVSQKLEMQSSLSYTPETDFQAENSRELATVRLNPSGTLSAIDVRDIPVADTDFTFPSQLTVGLGIGQPKKWFVGAEYTDQKTSNFTNRTFNIENVQFNDASKYRIGGFFIPNYNALGSYLKRVNYRAGFRFEETGLSINGEDINEFGISFGVGLPVARLFSNINIGFEYGMRGTKNAGLVEENFFNAFLSLSLNDRWFEKRYYD
ncbi:MAG: hypothetical protein CMC08_09695 [Flavobacteriaceae bacterium]|nr:hypothetical protein [Flavobacteriaceae bacterium]